MLQKRSYLHKILFLFLFYLPLRLAGQTVITGSVIDSKTRQPVVAATCMALDVRDGMTSYCITDETGNFKLPVSDSVRTLRISSLGYADSRTALSKDVSVYNVLLKPTSVVLKGVEVKVPPVRVDGDTINYNIAAIKNADDISLEDVLKHMPGIQVTENGSILYNGEGINGVNIEGQNLLGGGYRTATRGLPADAVAAVQVIENDQPVKALKKTQPSDKATLNIKLNSRHKLRPFGEINAGAGFDGSAVYDAKATCIHVVRARQTMITAETDNSGRCLGSDDANGIDLSASDITEPVPSRLLGRETVVLPVSKRRYADNASKAVSLNHLERLTKDSRIRTNLNITNDMTWQRDSSFSFYDGVSTFSLSETRRMHDRAAALSGSIDYELNAATAYIKDEVKTAYLPSRQNGCITGNGEQASQNVSAHPYYVQNDGRLTLSHGAMIYDIQSFTRFYSARERISGLMIPVSHAYDARRFLTKNSISTSVQAGRHSIGLKYKLYYISDRTASPDVTHSHLFLNDFSAELTLNYGRGYMTFSLPLTVGSKTYLSPEIYLSHRFSPLWRMHINMAYGKSNGDNFIMADTLMTGYRDHCLTADGYDWTRKAEAAFYLAYADMAEMVCWNFLATVTHTRHEYTNESLYMPASSLIEAIQHRSSTSLLYLRTNIDKTFAGTGLAAKLLCDYWRNDIPLRQNGLDMRLQTNSLSTEAELTWNKIKWLRASWNGRFAVSWQNAQPGSCLHEWHNNASLSFSFSKTVSLKTSLEHAACEISHGSYKTDIYLDASLRCKIGKRVEVHAGAANLMNRRDYTTAVYDGRNYLYNHVPLRPRSLIASVIWHY